MAQGGAVDDDYCKPCQARKIRVPRPTRRYCSWGKNITLHACADANVVGRDEYMCCAPNCLKKTCRCNHCLRAMAKVRKAKSLDMCDWCFEANSGDMLGAARKAIFA